VEHWRDGEDGTSFRLAGHVTEVKNRVDDMVSREETLDPVALT